ncbi:MAG TPA: hypothetical protein VKX49_00225 [Bryobacteraceae bacterium]|jgi:hypothetical protein|nr:hypothetical protein [Bryobacteraceae bacterium]
MKKFAVHLKGVSEPVEVVAESGHYTRDLLTFYGEDSETVAEFLADETQGYRVIEDAE